MGSWANQQTAKWEKECKLAKKNGSPMPPKPDVDMKAYIKAHPEIDDKMKKNMLNKYNKAKSAYDAKINRAYYMSKGFWKNTSEAAALLGLSMGLRQVLGLVFTEIWLTVKDAIIEARGDEKKLFNCIAIAVKRGFENARIKFKELWDKFIEGAVSGILSSLVTTLTNIFFTTAKNIIKIIRESFASLTQAAKILFVNPDDYPLGEKILSAAKILATGASVVAGSMVNTLLSENPIGTIPILNDILPTFCGALVSGIMSCSFLYIFNYNKVIKKAVEMLNELPSIDNFNYSLKKQSELLDKYLSKLMKIDFDLLQKQEENFSLTARQLSTCRTLDETNGCLHSIYRKLNLSFPWGNYTSFDLFMNDKSARLVFE